MAQERFDIPIKEMNDYDEEYDNDDDYSDYDDDDRYPYSGSAQDRGRRGNSFSYSGSGHSNEINEDSRKDHHNQLERKRRASIKSSYTELRESIPSLRDNKASRSVILQKAVDYLEELNRRNMDHVACVDHFSSENSALEAKCRDIENHVQILLRQQRQNGSTPNLINSHNYNTNNASNNINNTLAIRSSFRVRDEEDSNDLTGGSTNSTPTASTSRSLTSLSTTSTNRTEANAASGRGSDDKQVYVLPPESSLSNGNSSNSNNNNNHDHPTTLDTGSNSSSADYYDDLEEVVAPKKPRKE